MLSSLNIQQISFLVILVIAFWLLVTERLRNDMVSVLIISISPIGLSLSLAGTLFMLVIGRFLLPEREGGCRLPYSLLS